MKECRLETIMTILKDSCSCLAIIMGFFIFIIFVVIFIIIVGIPILTYFLTQKLKALLMMIDKDRLIKKLKKIGHYSLEVLCSKFLCTIFVFFISFCLTLNFYWEDKDIYHVLIPIMGWWKDGKIPEFFMLVATCVIAYFTYVMSGSVKLQREQLDIEKENTLIEFLYTFKGFVIGIVEKTMEDFGSPERDYFINIKKYPKLGSKEDDDNTYEIFFTTENNFEKIRQKRINLYEEEIEKYKTDSDHVKKCRYS